MANVNIESFIDRFGFCTIEGEPPAGDLAVNLSQVRVISRTPTGECVLWFDSSHNLRISGSAAAKLLAAFEIEMQGGNK